MPVLMLLQIYGCKAGQLSDFKSFLIIIDITNTWNGYEYPWYVYVYVYEPSAGK